MKSLGWLGMIYNDYNGVKNCSFIGTVGQGMRGILAFPFPLRCRLLLGAKTLKFSLTHREGLEPQTLFIQVR